LSGRAGGGRVGISPRRLRVLIHRAFKDLQRRQAGAVPRTHGSVNPCARLGALALDLERLITQVGDQVRWLAHGSLSPADAETLGHYAEQYIGLVENLQEEVDRLVAFVNQGEETSSTTPRLKPGA
jgi:hypothetical protein